VLRDHGKREVSDIPNWPKLTVPTRAGMAHSQAVTNVIPSPVGLIPRPASPIPSSRPSL